MSLEQHNREWHPLEYAHVFLWLIKDMCWAQGWISLGTFMVIPTILVAYIITCYQRKHLSNFIHNLAISLWISSNSLWMLAEFFKMESLLKPWASVGFGLGLALLLGFYGFKVKVKS
jgi:hypothetical protein